MQSELTVGQAYIKVHKVDGHHCEPRTFLGVSSSGYVQFAGSEAGQIMSESPTCWTFYKLGDPTLPSPIKVPTGWVEGAGGYYNPSNGAAVVEEAPVSIPVPESVPAPVPVLVEAPVSAPVSAPAPVLVEVPVSIPVPAPVPPPVVPVTL